MSTNESVENSAVEMWEQQLDQMGHTAPLENLKAHLAIAPAGAESVDSLSAFIAGAERA